MTGSFYVSGILPSMILASPLEFAYRSRNWRCLYLAIFRCCSEVLLYFIFIFLLLTPRKATRALIHRVSNYPDLLPEMPTLLSAHAPRMIFLDSVEKHKRLQSLGVSRGKNNNNVVEMRSDSVILPVQSIHLVFEQNTSD